MKRLLSLAATTLFTAAGTCHGETLAEIYQLALKNDPTIRVAEATFKIGQEGLVAPRRELLPKVLDSANASYSLGQGRTEIKRGGDTDITTTQRGNKSFNVNGISYSFNVRNWFNFKAAEHNVAQAEAQFALDQQNLIVRVVGAYLDVLRANESLDIARNNAKESKRRLENSRERFAVGLVSITDVHQSQATFDNAQVTVLQAEGDFAIKFEALEVLTGQRHFEVTALKSDFPIENPAPTNRDQWVELALVNNQTLKVAEHTKQSALQNAKGTKLNYTPTVSMSVSGYSYNDSPATERDFGTGVVPFPATETTSYGDTKLSVSVPVFTWGANKSERRVAAQREIQAHENYVNARRAAVQSTRSSFLTASTNVARVKALASAVKSAQSAYEATQAGFEAGTQNVLDVLQEQTRLFTAQQNYANARYDYINSLLQLKLQAGMLSPDDIATLDGWLKPDSVIQKEHN